jgi:DNA-binding XRE family transcriptional regulator
MRFVPQKTVAQQDLQCLHRVRSRLVSNRTQLINQIRGLLAEYGIVLPQHPGQVHRSLRTRQSKSQATAASGIGCEEFYLRNIEQGKENFPFDVMFAIVDYFGMLPLSKFWSFAEDLASINSAIGSAPTR